MQESSGRSRREQEGCKSMSSRTRGYLACTYHSHLACAAAQGPSHRHHCDVAIESIFTVGGEVLLGPQEPRRLQPPELATRAAAGRGRCYARGGRVRVSHARSPLSRPRASLLLSCRLVHMDTTSAVLCRLLEFSSTLAWRPWCSNP